MGILYSVNQASTQLVNSQKLYRYNSGSGNNEVIINPSDFRAFVKSFRSLQWRKEDSQIELRNLVLEWKSRLRLKQETKDIRTQAYELIETIEKHHDEQDAMLESENTKLDILTREMTKDNKGDVSVMWGEEDEFDGIKKEVWRRRQYLQVFNNQSTTFLKLALLDIEACQKMVDICEDFKDNESGEESSIEEEEENVSYSV